MGDSDWDRAFPSVKHDQITASQFMECRVLNTPAAVGDAVYVTVPSFDQTLRFGPVQWYARGTTLPAKNDDGLLVQSRPSGLYWLLAYGN